MFFFVLPTYLIFARNTAIALYSFKYLLTFASRGMSESRHRAEKSRPCQDSNPSHVLQREVCHLIDNGDAKL